MSMKLIALLVIITFSVGVAQPPAKSKSTGQYVDLRGFKMYYETYGSGEPLLLIHGNGGSGENFQNQILFFAKKYKVILPDSRAQGKSVDDGDSLSYEMMADDFSALLDYLKIDSCNVIGWSDGGINGLLLAMRHPKQVKKLAITGTNLWPDSTALDPWLYKKMINDYAKLSALPLTQELKNNKKLLKLMLDQPQIRTADLKNVHCPTLVIGGDHDVILPRHTLVIAESISRSYLWIVPNSGHSTLMTYKEDFNKIVLDFLQRPYRRIEGSKRFE